jgi:hypothetical protein
MFPSVTATAVVEAVDRVIGSISAAVLWQRHFRGDPGVARDSCANPS